MCNTGNPKQLRPVAPCSLLPGSVWWLLSRGGVIVAPFLFHMRSGVRQLSENNLHPAYRYLNLAGLYHFVMISWNLLPALDCTRFLQPGAHDATALHADAHFCEHRRVLAADASTSPAWPHARGQWLWICISSLCFYLLLSRPDGSELQYSRQQLRSSRPASKLSLLTFKLVRSSLLCGKMCLRKKASSFRKWTHTRKPFGEQVLIVL